MTLLFCKLIFGHYLADFPLQGDFIAKMKCRCAGINGQWFHCLTAHAIIHAGFVGFITGSLFIAMLEFVLHWLIDFAKCEGWTNLHVDQILHWTCKALYVLVPL